MVLEFSTDRTVEQFDGDQRALWQLGYEIGRRFFGVGFCVKPRGQPDRVGRVACSDTLRLAGARNVVAHIGAKHALSQKRQLVAGLCGFFEFEIFRVIHHLLFEPLDFLR